MPFEVEWTKLSYSSQKRCFNKTPEINTHSAVKSVNEVAACYTTTPSNPFTNKDKDHKKYPHFRMITRRSPLKHTTQEANFSLATH